MPRRFASLSAISRNGFAVALRHIGKARAKAFVVRPDQRIRTLQIDVIADDHQRALLEFAY